MNIPAFEIYTEQETFPGLFAACAPIIAAGGAISNPQVDCVRVLGTISLGGQVVGTGSIKQPSEAFVERVSNSSRVPLHGLRELGYMAIEPPHRGKRYATGIAGLLLAAVPGDEKIFSITTEENIPMQKTLLRHGFVMQPHVWTGIVGGRWTMWLRN